jgi:hypothetical protein
VLAYVFWHRPGAGVEAAEYEAAQREFQARIDGPSACFHVAELPFSSSPGYEDWYLVEDWAGLGALNAAAVDAARGAQHDRAAALVGAGWAGVYGLVRGAGTIPEAASWRDKPRGRDLDAILADIGDAAAWRRQMVLGPAPELCVAAGGPARRRVS